MPKPSSHPTYMMASSVLAERATSGVPRHTGAASTATTAIIRVATGSSTSALSRRFSMPEPRGAPNATLVGIATSHPTETPLAALVVGDGAVEIRRPEIGPERRRHPELGVGDLPQQEVRHAHLAARADQQIGIRHALRVERAADVRLRY